MISTWQKVSIISSILLVVAGFITPAVVSSQGESESEAIARRAMEDSLVANLDRIATAAESSSSITIENLREQKRELKQSAKDLGNEVKTLNREVAVKSEKIERLDSDLVEAKAECATLETELAASQRELAEVRRVMASLQAEKKQLTDRNYELEGAFIEGCFLAWFNADRTHYVNARFKSLGTDTITLEGLQGQVYVVRIEGLADESIRMLEKIIEGREAVKAKGLRIALR